MLKYTCTLKKFEKVRKKWGFKKINKVSLQYIFILSVKFENLTVRLHVLIISFVLAKFQKDQRSIGMSSNKC